MLLLPMQKWNVTLLEILLLTDSVDAVRGPLVKTAFRNKHFLQTLQCEPGPHLACFHGLHEQDLVTAKWRCWPYIFPYC